MSTTKAIRKACKNFGNQSALAEAMGLSRRTLSKWQKTGKVPPQHVLMLEALTGVHRSELNPRIYPPASTPPPPQPSATPVAAEQQT